MAMSVTCGCERNTFGTIEKLCADHSFAEQRRCHGLIKRADEVETALRNLVADVDDYERVNDLAPNPGRLHCWESMRVAKDVLGQSAPKPTKE
jgi:hypothetical protein